MILTYHLSFCNKLLSKLSKKYGDEVFSLSDCRLDKEKDFFERENKIMQWLGKQGF